MLLVEEAPALEAAMVNLGTKTTLRTALRNQPPRETIHVPERTDGVPQTHA